MTQKRPAAALGLREIFAGYAGSGGRIINKNIMLEDSWNRIVPKQAVLDAASTREETSREEASSFVDNLDGSGPWSASKHRERGWSSESAANSDGSARQSSTDLTAREAPEKAGETPKQPADESEEARTKGGSGRGPASPRPERDTTQEPVSMESGRAGHFSLSSFRSDEEYPDFFLDFKLKVKLFPNYRLAPPEARDKPLPAPATPALLPSPSPHWQPGRPGQSNASGQPLAGPSWPGPQTAVFSRPRYAAAAPIPWPQPWMHQPEASGGPEQPQSLPVTRRAGGGPAPTTAPAPRSSQFVLERPGFRRFAPAC